MTEPRTIVEEVQITGDKLLETVRKLVHEGSIRHISIRNAEGRTLLEIPLVVGIAGVALVPVLAAVGAFAALVADCTLVVQRVEPPGDETPGDGPVKPPAPVEPPPDPPAGRSL